MDSANRRSSISIGERNSSRSISPGWVARRFVGMLPIDFEDTLLKLKANLKLLEESLLS